MKDIKYTKTIDILSEPESEMTNISDIALDIKYIPLETPEDVLIGVVRKVVTTKNCIYISTVDKVFCFDKMGKYLRRLERLGRGPEEYSYLFDYDVSQNDNILAVISLKCLMLYKKEGSEYSFLKKMNYYPSRIDFIPDQDNILLTYGTSIGTEPFRHLIVNLEGDTLNARPNPNRVTNSGLTLGLLFENVSFKFDNVLHFKELLNDTVYSVDPVSRIKPYLVFDSKGKKPTPETRANGQYFKNHMAEFIMFDNILEAPRYIFYSFMYQKARHFYIYDKVTNKKYGLNTNSWLKDNISGGIGFKPIIYDNIYLYSWVEALILKKLVDSNEFKDSTVKNPNKKLALEKLGKAINETDNPILIMVSLKN
jgi:hypothetical protein